MKCLNGQPHLVKLLEVLRGQNHVCLVMNHVVGGNCFQLVAKNFPLSVLVLRRLFTGVCRGISAMHVRGFIHRDVKPENILISDSGEAVVVDFGLCAKATPGSMMKDCVGTKGFIAPEVNGGRPFEPLPTDCFSLGSTLVELIYGNGTVTALSGICPEDAAQKFTALRERMLAQELEVKLPGAEVPDCADLIACLLNADGRLRLSATKALDHPFLMSAPPPSRNSSRERSSPSDQSPVYRSQRPSRGGGSFVVSGGDGSLRNMSGQSSFQEPTSPELSPLPPNVQTLEPLHHGSSGPRLRGSLSRSRIIVPGRVSAHELPRSSSTGSLALLSRAQTSKEVGVLR